MNNHFSTLDVFILLTYTIGIVGLGVYFIKKNKSPEAFTVANASLPGWAV
ncbi:MAG: hypothetical protein GY757_14005, partial [bacterium]|nr:hypothetical protein [bacterium]